MTGAFDEWTTPAVRPYVITGGRSGAAEGRLPLETLVVASGMPLPTDLQPEYRRIVERCQGLLSIAEVAAHLGQPPQVVQVLLADLIESGHIQTRPPVGGGGGRHESEMLRKVLHGLENQL
jgi:hypothetical protein